MRDIFLKIDGLKGESLVDGHKGEIQVSDCKWGTEQPGGAHVGMGGSKGKVVVKDLVVTKYVDKATPELFKASCNAKVFKEATLTVRKSGEKPLDYLKIKMSDVQISKMEIDSKMEIGGNGNEDFLTEYVSLHFDQVEVEYTPQKSDGSGDAAVTTGWNIKTSKEL
jgi:type VI secretion system secreted protein Hcp